MPNDDAATATPTPFPLPEPSPALPWRNSLPHPLYKTIEHAAALLGMTV